MVFEKVGKDKKFWKRSVIAEIHPEDLTKSMISLALEGKKIQDPKDVDLPYFDPEGAKEYFLKAVKNWFIWTQVDSNGQ